MQRSELAQIVDNRVDDDPQVTLLVVLVVSFASCGMEGGAYFGNFIPGERA